MATSKRPKAKKSPKIGIGDFMQKQFEQNADKPKRAPAKPKRPRSR